MKKTSLDAYEKIIQSGRKQTFKQQVYNYIKTYPGCTQLDISRFYGESARKRISELVRDGLIYEDGTMKIGRYEYTCYRIVADIQRKLFI